MLIPVRSVAVAFSLLVCGQEVKKVAEPEFSGVPQVLDSGGGLSALERQPVNAAMKAKGLGLAGGKMVVLFKGSKSPIRFPSSSKVEFVVRVESTEKDPESQINLDALKTEKSNRYLVLAKAGAFGFGGKSTAGEAFVSLKYSKHGERSIRFWADQPLPSGEYVITTSGSRTAFLFGID